MNITFLNNLLNFAVNKAKKSVCRYKVSALGFNRKGDFIGVANNFHKFHRKGGSVHAELSLINKLKKKLTTIVIVRSSKNGNLLPIHPCKNCSHIAKKYGIEIKTVEEL